MFDDMSDDMIKLTIAFRGWNMAACDYANGDFKAALAKHPTDRFAYRPSKDCKHLAAYQEEYARRVKAKCGM